jgi:hypothetical protein
MTFDPDAGGELERLLAELDQVDAGIQRWAEDIAAVGIYGRKGDPHLWTTPRLEALAQAVSLYCEVHGCRRIEAVGRMHKRYPALFDRSIIALNKMLKNFSGRSKRASAPAAAFPSAVPVNQQDLRELRNVLRDLPPSERAERLIAMEPELKDEAQKRIRKHGGTARGRRAQPGAAAGRIRDRLREISGIGGKTAEREMAVVKAGKAEPERLGYLIAEMDAHGVNSAYRKLREHAH